MIAFRISKANYAKSLQASGSANRWNRSGQFVLYCASSRALATLELLAHRNAIMPKAPYKLMHMEFDERLVTSIGKLPKQWNTIAGMHKTQALGAAWYQKQGSVVLKVPSALIKDEYNFVINVNHPDFKKVSLVRTENFVWDGRLL
jgi:RES domain-containing protein